MNATEKIKQRLEYLRGELRAERISLDELVELESIAVHIDPEDVELLEAAGVSESEYRRLLLARRRKPRPTHGARKSPERS